MDIRDKIEKGGEVIKNFAQRIEDLEKEVFGVSTNSVPGNKEEKLDKKIKDTIEKVK